MKHLAWTALIVFLLPVVMASTHGAYSEPRAGFSAGASVSVEDTAVYTTGYVSENGSEWTPITLTGDVQKGDWVLGTASSDASLNGIRYVAIYSCTWNDAWDCSETWQVRDRGPQSGPGTLDSLEGDYQALQDFYHAMDGPNWDDNTGWPDMTPETMGDAFGVTVYPEGHEHAGRVKELSLSGGGGRDTQDVIGNGLVGNSIPDSFGNLKQMQQLRLKGNDITARIDNWVQGLTGIVGLRLSNNVDVNGQNEFNYSNDVRYNHPGKTADSYNLWQGPIPDDLSMLTNLELFEVAKAELTGSLPTHLPDSIIAFIVNDNHLSGELPAWENAANMTHLYLSNRYDEEGKFTGPVPPEWNNMKDMSWFYIFVNELDGDFPQFDAWTDLQKFNIGGNRFTGQEPSYWLFDEPDDHPDLNSYGTSGNRWEGGLLQDFQAPDRTFYVSTSWDNEPGLTGPVPEWIFAHRNRQVLMGKNQFTSLAPGAMIPARNKLLWLDRNNISGQLPPLEEPYDSPQFRVRFWSNNFSGTIPDWSGATGVATTDVYVQLHDNQLEGLIPAYFGDFDPGAFGSFTVHDNKFTPKDILPHRAAIQAAADNYQYLPQKPFGQAQTVSVGATIDRSEFAYTGNTYQWVKDGSALAGETAPTIDTASYGAGEYVLQIIHPDLDFTFESEPITVAQAATDSQAGDEDALEALYVSANGDSWNDNTGWSSSGMDLNDEIHGVTVEQIDGEMRVTEIDLRLNSLTGDIDIPQWENLKELRLLNIMLNSLSSLIPESLMQAENLEYLYLSGSDQTAPIHLEHPHEAATTGGGSIHIGKDAGREENHFYGPIPENIDNLQKLKWIGISWTDTFKSRDSNGRETMNKDGITSIPMSLWNIDSLVGIQIYENWNIQEDFSYPQTIGHIENLSQIYLGGGSGTAWDEYVEGGYMKGGYPEDFEQTTKLRHIWLQRLGHLTGFPDLSNNPDLGSFLIPFTNAGDGGQIPDWVTNGSAPRMDLFSVAWPTGEGFTGTVPEFGEMRGLDLFSLTGHSLEGEIPASFFHTRPGGVRKFNFQNNKFTSVGTDDLTHFDNAQLLRWRDNEISGRWPNLDWGGGANTVTTAQFDQNKYVFRDMLWIPSNGGGKTIFDLYNENIERFSYGNQKPFGEPNSYTINTGGSLSIDDFNSYVSHADNQYQWQLDGSDVSGATSRELTISDAQSSDAGTYELVVTNPGVPDLALTSEPITLSVN